MSFSEPKYQPLEQESKKTSLDYHHLPYQTPPTKQWKVNALIITAILSLVANLLFTIYAIKTPLILNVETKDKTLYAGLERDVPTPFKDDTLFSPNNRSLSDAAWDNWVVDPGIVALPHDWVKAKMLPQAQHWPWDGDKGVYLLNGFHNLHCLQLLRQSLIDAFEGKDINSDDRYIAHALEHNLHCIESLRQDAMCHADDTPRYSGYSKKEVSGVMQTRMCRSWDKLEAFARDHTACYRDIGRGVEGFPQIEKYKFCPEGYVFAATGSPIPPWETGTGHAHPGDE